ncbi:hypothetical protein T261_8573 [Streptomyces lydicus]|nr:hypothetical protein T261_8573 [Streptomyces lydicus]
MLALAEAVGEPVTVMFMWEGREEAERAVLVPAAEGGIREVPCPAGIPR